MKPAPLAQRIAMRLEGTPQNPARAAFMQALSEHEDLVAEAAAFGYSATRIEKLRLSRRVVIATYDRASLSREADTDAA
jgi:hypothetical protein